MSKGAFEQDQYSHDADFLITLALHKTKILLRCPNISIITATNVFSEHIMRKERTFQINTHKDDSIKEIYHA